MFFIMILLEITCRPVKSRLRLSEIKDYVVLQKFQEQDDRVPPPRTLILDFTLTRVLEDQMFILPDN
jgi:hypothetical protein